MKKESFATLTIFSGRLLAVGLLALLFASSSSCALTAPATGSANLMVKDRLPQKQDSHARSSKASDSDSVETRLTELFDLCRSDKLEEAAAYFVYRGPDKKREWKDTFRASDPVEKAGAGEICRRITKYLDESQGYQFGQVKVERESEGVWHALEVSFLKDDQTKKVIFAFLKIKGQFAIGDIDD